MNPQKYKLTPKDYPDRHISRGRIKTENTHSQSNWVSFQLSEAIKNNNTDGITRIIFGGVSPNYPLQDSIGRKETPLIVALRAEKPESFETLLKVGADPNIDGFLNKPPLWYAAKSGNLACINKLLKYKVQVTPTNGSRNPINLLTRFINNAIEEVWYLDGPAMFPSVMEFGLKPRTEKLTIITELIAAGVPLNQKDENKKTPLYWSLKNNDFDLFMLLTSSGANIPQKREMKLSELPTEWRNQRKLDWLNSVRNKPRSLSDLTRITIRNTILKINRTDIRPSIDKLPLPRILKSYLKFWPEIDLALRTEPRIARDSFQPPPIHFFGPPGYKINNMFLD